MKRIYREARDEVTPGEIAKRLNRENISSPRGSVWRSNSVRIILTNPAYCGERHGVEKTHTAIISRRLFNEVERTLLSRGRERTDGGSS